MLKTLALAAGVAMAAQSSDIIQTSTEEVIQLWSMANAECRGGSPASAEMYGACGARDVYQQILADRGMCYGKEGQAGAEMEFHDCEPDSLPLAE